MFFFSTKTVDYYKLGESPGKCVKECMYFNSFLCPVCVCDEWVFAEISPRYRTREVLTDLVEEQMQVVPCNTMHPPYLSSIQVAQGCPRGLTTEAANTPVEPTWVLVVSHLRAFVATCLLADCCLEWNYSLKQFHESLLISWKAYLITFH